VVLISILMVSAQITQPGPCLPAISGEGKMLIESFASLPMGTDAAWLELKQEADTSQPLAEFFLLNSNHDVWTLANALVYAANGDPDYRTNAILGIQGMYMVVTASSLNTTVIGPCRNLLGYVIAADIVGLDAVDKPMFLEALNILHEATSWIGDGCTGKSISDCHDMRPNNHGAYCGGAAIAMEQYLARESAASLVKQAHMEHLCDRKGTFRAFVGQTGHAFTWGNDLTWHDPTLPLKAIGGVNEVSDGRSLDGAIGDDMRRVGDGPPGPFDPSGCDSNMDSNCLLCPVTDPPDDDQGHCTSIACWDAHRDKITGAEPTGPSLNSNRSGYSWETMQGLVMQAQLLSRSGWQSWSWQSAALNRATRFLYKDYGLWAQDCRSGRICQGGGMSNVADDTWVPWIIEAVYDPAYLDPSDWTTPQTPLEIGTVPGKNFGFAEWWAAGI
jgi:hypothetical protein